MAAEPPDSHDRANGFLLVAILALSAFPLLLLLRRLDDNTLTSWKWAAAAVDPARVFLLQAAAAGAAFFLARLSPRGRWTGLLLFILAAGSATLFWPLPEVVIDASRYFTQAKHLEVHGLRFFLREWGGEIDAWTDMPLMPLVYGLLFRYLGESRLYVQVLNTLLFALAVLATFHAGRALWDRETGFCASLFLLAVPYLYTQVPLMLTDVPAMFLVVLSLLASLTAIQRGGCWLLAPALPLILTALVKYSTWPLLAAGLPLLFLGTAPRKGWRVAARRSAALAVFPGGILTACALWKRDVIGDQISLLTGFQWQGLTWWQESHLSTFFFQTHPFVTVLALFGAALALRRRDASCALPLGLVLLLLGMGVERARYLLVVFPMVALAAGYGLQPVSSPRLKRYVACTAFLSSLALSASLFRPFLMNISLVNLQEAGALLDSRGIASARVFTLPPNSSLVNAAVAVPLFDLYFSGTVAYEPGAVPPPGAAAAVRSPFRFSWQYRNPEYYAARPVSSRRKSAVVVISGGDDPLLPPGLAEEVRLLERHPMTVTSGVYRFRTLVFAYLPPHRERGGPRRGAQTLEGLPERRSRFFILVRRLLREMPRRTAAAD